MSPCTLACGMCMFNSCEWTFPATMAWSLIVPSWYLALCAFARHHDLELTGMRSFWKSGLLVVGALLLAFWELGPIPLIPFGPICAVATVQYFRAAGGLGTGARAVGHAIGVVAVLALGITAVSGFVAMGVPATADSVLRQPPHSNALTMEFRKLRRAEPGTLPVYRELVRRAPGASLLRDALERVKELGRPEEEVPFLLDVLEARLRAGERHRAEVVEEYLRRMSGCEPEPDSGVKGWREAWKKKQQGE